MSKELREAAEYVLESDGQEGDGICESWTDPAFVEKAQAVARAYLALLSSAPADDGDEPVTQDWFIESFGDKELLFDSKGIVWCDVENEVSLDVDDSLIMLPHIKTRRQVRNLLSALGIETTPKQEMEAKK